MQIIFYLLHYSLWKESLILCYTKKMIMITMVHILFQIFRPYARDWIRPLTQLIISGAFTGLNYFVIDLIVTIMSWHQVAIPQVMSIIYMYLRWWCELPEFSTQTVFLSMPIMFNHRFFKIHLVHLENDHAIGKYLLLRWRSMHMYIHSILKE